ncbi:MAG TPA: MMPL family transporter [Terrimesophilobacter sp.]|jgi:Predicted drug exporters of the RND superfamily|uniref:MMPL family transporter n=1 Tax=Terrimesophilobacter sp. TaxID=2906435 RepID=UPI002F935CD6
MSRSSVTPPATRTAKRRVPAWLRILIPVALVLVWLAAGAAGGSAFGRISSVASNDQAQFLPASAEATKVQELQAEFRDSDFIPAVVVYQRDGGLTEADRALIGDQSAAFGEISGVLADSVSPAIPSEDGAAAEVFVPVDSTIKVSDTVKQVRAYLADHASEGLSVYVTGPAGLSADIGGAFSGIDGLLLLVAFAAVFIILVVVYRSPLLPLIVLGTSLFALTGAVLTVVTLASASVVTLTGQTQGILFILVIGAATDYSLLYVARYREALRDHERRWSATCAALKGSWEPILASGATVIAGLLILLFSDLNSNQAMGPVAAIGIGFALLAALTFLPAVMMFAGRVAFWPIRPRFGSAHPVLTGKGARGAWPRLSQLVSRRPRMIWIGTTLVLLVAAVGMLELKADGVSQSEFVLGHSEARDGQTVLGEHFPGGSGTPAVVVGPEGSLTSMAEVILDNDGVASLAAIAHESPSGTIPLTSGAVREMQESTTTDPEGAGPAPGDEQGTPAFRTAPTVVDGRVMLQATLDAPGDSAEAEATVRELRAQLAGVDGDVLVGGVTAVALDTNDAAIHDRNLIIPLVLVVITLILMLLLRAVVAPLLLILSVVVSFGAALGVSALVFNEVFGFAGADPSVPMFGFVFLVALGIDYNIFLMTRVREESQKHGTREGVLRGLASTGGVITSAGLVLAATFAALGVLPILFLVQISFIVAFGVLLDTFIVRSLLVPALSLDIGRKIWWPGTLSRGAN